MESENYSLFILVNAYVKGYWKNVISRPNLSGRGDKALETLLGMCMTLTTQMKYEYNNRFTSLKMDPRKPVSMLLSKFSASKQHAEDAGLHFSNCGHVPQYNKQIKCSKIQNSSSNIPESKSRSKETSLCYSGTSMQQHGFQS